MCLFLLKDFLSALSDSSSVSEVDSNPTRTVVVPLFSTLLLDLVATEMMGLGEPGERALGWTCSLKPLCVSAWGFWWRGGCRGRWPHCGRRSGADTQLRQGQSHKKTSSRFLRTFQGFTVKGVYFILALRRLSSVSLVAFCAGNCLLWMNLEAFRTIFDMHLHWSFCRNKALCHFMYFGVSFTLFSAAHFP